MVRLLCIVCFALWAIGSPVAALAQGVPDLTVTLRDLNGAGVANIQVTLRDSAGQRDLDRVTTSTAGVAVFQRVLFSEVRVALTGLLPDGRAVVQLGDDARGIRLFLDPAATTLNLRVDVDGSILPDPATEFAQENPARAMPSADQQPIAGENGNAAQPVPSIQALQLATPRPVATTRPAQARPPDAPRDGLPWWAIVAIGVLVVGIVGLLVVGRRI